MGVHQPIVGFRTDALQISDGHEVDLFARTAQPRVEPEIAFRLGRVVDRLGTVCLSTPLAKELT